MTRKLAWKPDLPDFRDHLYETTGTALPTSVDLSPFCSPVEDQGDLGSCTANALVGAVEFLENKNSGEFEVNGKFVDLSRLFVYYGERVLEGTTKEDSGAYIRDGVKVLAQKGVSTEALCPYNVAKFKNKPASKAYTDAKKRKIAEYIRITTGLQGIKENVAAGYPVAFGFTVYSSFMTQHVADTGIMPMPAKNEAVEGGHAVLVVGYDDAKNAVLVRNSWGPDWGLKGYFWMPYAYISNANLCDDFWTIRK